MHTNIVICDDTSDKSGILYQPFGNNIVIFVAVNSVATAEETAVSTSNTNETLKIEESRSWTMIEYDRTSPSEVLPELPVKTKKNCLRYSWHKQELMNENSEMVDSLTTSNPNTELDQLISQLNDLNEQPDLRTSMPPPAVRL